MKGVEPLSKGFRLKISTSLVLFYGTILLRLFNPAYAKHFQRDGPDYNTSFSFIRRQGLMAPAIYAKAGAKATFLLAVILF